MSKHEAERSCVACREAGERRDLLRIVLSPDGEAVLDLRVKLPGRGAWVCATAACVDAIGAKPGLLARSFRQPVRAQGIPAEIRAGVGQACLAALSLEAARAALIVGQDTLIEALRAGRVAAVILASDTADRTLGRIRDAAGEQVVVVATAWTQDVLGDQVGQSYRAAIGVRTGAASVHLVRQLRRLHSLS